MNNPISDGEGIIFSKPNWVERTPEAIQVERSEILHFYGYLFAVVAGIFGLTYFMTPGYIIPLLNCPPARIILALILFWQAVGVWVHWYFAPLTEWKRETVRTLVCLFAFGPGFLYPTLGPACIGILYALGPIVSSK